MKQKTIEKYLEKQIRYWAQKLKISYRTIKRDNRMGFLACINPNIRDIIYNSK